MARVNLDSYAFDDPRFDGTSAGKGDSTSYTWYVFAPRASGSQGPRGGHHCIIPWKEAPHA